MKVDCTVRLIAQSEDVPQGWHLQTGHYAAECCDMTERRRVIGLLDAYAARQKEGQLAVLLYNAARMLEQTQ